MPLLGSVSDRERLLLLLVVTAWTSLWLGTGVALKVRRLTFWPTRSRGFPMEGCRLMPLLGSVSGRERLLLLLVVTAQTSLWLGSGVELKVRRLTLWWPLPSA